MKITKRQLRLIIKEEKAKLISEARPPGYEGTRTLDDQKVDKLYGEFLEMGVPADSFLLQQLIKRKGAEKAAVVARRMQAILDILDGVRIP